MTGKVQAIVADGISIGRPCCGIFRCTEPLQNNQHRFCATHFSRHDICAIDGCELPIQLTPKKLKTCTDPIHQEIERKKKARGNAAFILKDRWKDAQALYGEGIPTSAEEHVDVEDEVEWFEVNGTNVEIFNEKNPGSVGVVDDPDPCSKKSMDGNRKFKTQLSRRRTHNEETLVRPCSIIFARATMFGAESVSNFLVCKASINH